MKRLILAALAASLITMMAGFTSAAEEGSPSCEWLAGDLHVHTYYSHDSWAGPGHEDPNTDPFEDPPGSFADLMTLGLSVGEERDLAESRGLDYIAITDHDSTDAQKDPAFGTGSLIWVPDYENTIEGAGHAQMHGAVHSRFEHYEYEPEPDPVTGERVPRDAASTAAALRADGGAFQINHPSDLDWHTSADPSSYRFPELIPDALEVWNIGVWAYEPPMPATNDHEWAPSFYDHLLQQGERVAATGGSDSHWRATVAAQGVGQPTTWVCSSSRTWQGVVDGIRAHRTTISHQPPAYNGPFAYLEGDTDGDTANGYEAMIGDAVAPGADLRAVVQGAPGATLRIITDAGRTETLIDSPQFTYEFTAPGAGKFVRAEIFYPDGVEARRILAPICKTFSPSTAPDKRNAYCENRLAMVAMTSPIYFESVDDFDPTTVLVYDGDTSGQTGRTVTFAATLMGTDGPIPGATLTFEFQGATYTATTDDSGRGSVEVKLQGQPGTYDVVSRFAGSDTYSESTDTDTFRVTAGRS